MATRSLNKVMLIGNLTRDPELRYTPQGTAVCTMGLATNRTWVTDNGEKKEETEFHRIVAWNKLAELCSQLLFKGRRVYVEGRLQTRQWTAQDGTQRQATEIVIEDMLVLDSRRQDEPVAAFDEGQGTVNVVPAEEPVAAPVAPAAPVEEEPVVATKGKGNKKAEEVADDIPF
jgi:single-strand DNA-binding protein